MVVTVCLGADRLFSVVLGDSPIRIGRSRSCDVILPLPEVSRLHAVLIREPNGARIEDRSRNGITVNGRLVSSTIVHPGDTIGLLSYTIRFDADRPEVLDDTEAMTSPTFRHSGNPGVGFCEMLGRSEAMLRIYEQIRQLAATRLTVLILGETGTGKELVARALHSLGPRQNQPWVPVNCAAISAALIESELFGHERGAFTGAVTRKLGAFEVADGGTLFLDEVGEMPLDLQPKLLRTLDQGEVTRVGASRAIKVDARVISATNRDLTEEQRHGRFREDLYHRLCVVPIVLPPLRFRGQDILQLARHFADEQRIVPPLEFTEQAMHLMLDYGWPGNVRELSNVMRRLAAGRPRDLIDASTLQDALDAARNPLAPLTPSPVVVPSSSAPPEANPTLRDAERLAILRALEDSDGNKLAAAKRLGISRSTLYEKLHRLSGSED